MTSSRTALLTAFVLLLSAGCSYSVRGDALPQAGVTPTTSGSTRSGAPSDAPKIAKPRRVAGVEPCALLDADDLKSLGSYKEEPERKDDVIQESCQYVLDDGTARGLTVVAALYQPYEQVRTRQDKGHEVVVEGHSTWVLCDMSGSEMACTATLAVNANRSVLVAMAQPGGVPDRMLAVLQPLLKAALGRLPLA
ncbi:DUF3558 family protein [Saccharothrix isguenensis]